MGHRCADAVYRTNGGGEGGKGRGEGVCPHHERSCCYAPRHQVMWKVMRMERLKIVPKKKQSINFFSRSLPPSSLVPSLDIPERTWRFVAGVGGLLQVWAEECEPGGGVVMVEGGGGSMGGEGMEAYSGGGGGMTDVCGGEGGRGRWGSTVGCQGGG